MNNNDMSDLHFIVRDKNGRHWGISGDKLGEFKNTLDNIDNEKTPEQKKKIEDMKSEMLEYFIDNKIKNNNGHMVVDVCFNDSICGELKLHLHKKYQEIISIPLFFDIGNIKGDALDNQKPNIIDMYAPFGVSQKECDEIFENIKNNVDMVVSCAKNGATIRLWNENTPTSICGVYYLINLLKDIDCKICECPCSYFDKPNFDNMIELSKDKITEYSNKWDLLVEENAPLRVFKNGDIMGVEETYFDDLIFKIIGKRELLVPVIVGEVLSKYKISDSYIFDRIYHLVACGKLKIAGLSKKYDNKPNFYPYRHIIKMNDDSFGDEGIFFTDIIDRCLAKLNFSCAWLQKEFELPYALAVRLLTACEEMKIIEYANGETKILITLDDFIKNKRKYEKVLIKYNLL